MTKPTFPKVEKKHLCLVLPLLGSISPQVRSKIRNAVKGSLNCCKLQTILKSERKFSNMFKFKDCVPCDLVSGVVYEYACGRYNSPYCYETKRYLKVRFGELIRISLFTFKINKPSRESLICDQLLHCDYNPSFDEFIILG